MATTKAATLARRRRLLVLADFLERDVEPRLDGAKFDMSIWGIANDAIPAQISETSKCGFAGCAVGWAYYCAPLVKAGLRKVVEHEHDWLEIYDENRLAEFFGLTVDEKFKCFSPLAYEKGSSVGIGEVVARLRETAAATAGLEAAS